MPLIGKTDLVRIELPAAGEWVDVKRRLSRGDEIAVQRACMAGLTIPPTLLARLSQSGLTAVELGAAALEHGLDAATFLEPATFATLDVAIMGWSFEEPVSPTAIRALDGASVDAIVVALNGLYPGPRKDDDRGNSSAPGATPSAASPLLRPSLAG